MRKFLWAMLALVGVLVFAACGNRAQESEANHIPPIEIEYADAEQEREDEMRDIIDDMAWSEEEQQVIIIQYAVFGLNNNGNLEAWTWSQDLIAVLRSVGAKTIVSARMMPFDAELFIILVHDEDTYEYARRNNLDDIGGAIFVVIERQHNEVFGITYLGEPIFIDGEIIQLVN